MKETTIQKSNHESNQESNQKSNQESNQESIHESNQREKLAHLWKKVFFLKGQIENANNVLTQLEKTLGVGHEEL